MNKEQLNYFLAVLKFHYITIATSHFVSSDKFLSGILSIVAH